jgi:hypothetical protein
MVVGCEESLEARDDFTLRKLALQQSAGTIHSIPKPDVAEIQMSGVDVSPLEYMTEYVRVEAQAKSEYAHRAGHR